MKNRFSKLAVSVMTASLVTASLFFTSCTEDDPIAAAKKTADGKARVAVSYEKKDGFSEKHSGKALIIDEKKDTTIQDLYLTDSTLTGFLDGLYDDEEYLVELIINDLDGNMKFKGLVDLDLSKIDSLIDLHSNLYLIDENGECDLSKGLIEDISEDLDNITEEEIEELIKELIEGKELEYDSILSFFKKLIYEDDWKESELLELENEINKIIDEILTDDTDNTANTLDISKLIKEHIMGTDINEDDLMKIIGYDIFDKGYTEDDIDTVNALIKEAIVKYYQDADKDNDNGDKAPLLNIGKLIKEHIMGTDINEDDLMKIIGYDIFDKGYTEADIDTVNALIKEAIVKYYQESDKDNDNGDKAQLLDIDKLIKEHIMGTDINEDDLMNIIGYDIFDKGYTEADIDTVNALIKEAIVKYYQESDKDNDNGDKAQLLNIDKLIKEHIMGTDINEGDLLDIIGGDIFDKGYTEDDIDTVNALIKEAIVKYYQDSDKDNDNGDKAQLLDIGKLIKEHIMGTDINEGDLLDIIGYDIFDKGYTEDDVDTVNALIKEAIVKYYQDSDKDNDNGDSKLLPREEIMSLIDQQLYGTDIDKGKLLDIIGGDIFENEYTQDDIDTVNSIIKEAIVKYYQD